MRFQSLKKLVNKLLLEYVIDEKLHDDWENNINNITERLNLCQKFLH